MSNVSKRLRSLKELAYKEAIKGVNNRHKHGAVVMAGNRILAKACNNSDNKSHAEVRAIKRIPHESKHLATSLIVVRATKSKKFGLSKPCKNCQKAIREANIKVVYYSDTDETLKLMELE